MSADLDALVASAADHDTQTLRERTRIFAAYARIQQLERDLIEAIKAAYPNGCRVFFASGANLLEGTVLNSDACGFLLVKIEGHSLPCAVQVVNDKNCVRRLP
jgi:hypothetical protein